MESATKNSGGGQRSREVRHAGVSCVLLCICNRVEVDAVGLS